MTEICGWSNCMNEAEIVCSECSTKFCGECASGNDYDCPECGGFGSLELSIPEEDLK